MSFDSKRIAALSRDQRFQFKTVVIILLFGLAVALGISLWHKASINIAEREEVIIFPRKEIEITSRQECVRLLEEVRELRADMQDALNEEGDGPATAPEALSATLNKATPFLREEEISLFANYADRMMSMTTIEPSQLQSFAFVAGPHSGLAGSMHGDLLRLAGQYEESLAAYERGALDPETGADSCRRALDLCRRRNWKDKVVRLYQQPGWREAVLEDRPGFDDDAWHVAQAAGDWTGVLRQVWQNVMQRLHSPVWVTLAALCGMLWFLIFHFGAAVPVRLWWRGLLAFSLGLLSIPLTHVIDVLQEIWFGAQPEGSHLTDIFYCVSGIGLREEVAKLLLFVPMLFVLRKATPAQVLAVAACTGLGFGTLENAGYFTGQLGTSVWGRFLTAGFAHSAMTGLTGLGLWQAVRNSKWLPHFATVFVGVVLFHGLWDWSPQDVRLAGDYRYLMYALLVGLSWYFFGELLRYTQPQPGVPSAVFVFLAGGTVLQSVLMSVMSWHFGFRLGIGLAMAPVLHLFAIGAAMFYQLRRA